ncbi:MAG: hypothetical protein IIW10_03480 [Spirochaetaceae bacterium]|nr:hypothetical protein [Spirochaetaceae bacterium]
MRKGLFIIALVAMVASSVFAQEEEKAFTVSQSAKVQYRFGNSGFDEDVGLKRFRAQYEITAANDLVSLWYRARLNGSSWGAFNWADANSYWNCIIPRYNEGSNSQANLVFTPFAGALKVAVGTDLWWQLPGVATLADDDYYQDYGKLGNKHIGAAWAGVGGPTDLDGDEKTDELEGVNSNATRGTILRPYLAAVDGVAIQYNAPFGLSVTASVPWQNLQAGRGDDFLMRWGLSYGLTLSEKKIFNLGLGLVSTYNSGDNPWSLYAGVEVPCVPVVQPKLSYMLFANGTNQKTFGAENGLSADTPTYNVITIAAPGSVGSFSFSPEFAMGFYGTKDIDEEDQIEIAYQSAEDLGKMYGPAIFFAVPVAYNIDDVCAVDLWFSGDFGSIKKYADEKVAENRFVVKPGVTVKTPFGKFNAQFGLLIDTRFDGVDAHETKCGYMGDLSWSLNF